MTNTTSLAKKAQSLLYFLRKLRKAQVPPPILCSFYRGTIESILTSCITVWYGCCTASCRKTLQCIVNAASKIIGVALPSLIDIFHTCLTSRAISIAADSSHLLKLYFSLLSSGRRYRSIQAHSTRLSNNFIHQAVRILNSVHYLPPSTSTYSWTLKIYSSPHTSFIEHKTLYTLCTL